MPKRVQLRRTAGWRKPPNTVVVARPSRWGNPFRIGEHGTLPECVDLFRSALSAGQLAFTVDDVRDRLAGKDLGCWCGLDGACHADVLLEFANSVPGPVRSTVPGSDQESEPGMVLRTEPGTELS